MARSVLVLNDPDLGLPDGLYSELLDQVLTCLGAICRVHGMTLDVGRGSRPLEEARVRLIGLCKLLIVRVVWLSSLVLS